RQLCGFDRPRRGSPSQVPFGDSEVCHSVVTNVRHEDTKTRRRVLPSCLRGRILKMTRTLHWRSPRMKSASLLLVGLWMIAAVTIGGVAQAPEKRSVWSGVYSEEQAKRGEMLYVQHCSSCHGTTLEGGEMAPPLAGGAFNSNWNDLSLGDIVERIRTTM